MANGFTVEDITTFFSPESSFNQQIVPATIMSTEQEQSSRNNQQQQSQQQLDESDGGFIASGMAWVDKQREKRRREYLKIEAKKQLQKIGHAERVRKEALLAGNSVDGFGSDRSHSLVNSSSSSLSKQKDHTRPVGLTTNRSLGSTSSSDSVEVDLDGETNQNIGGTSDVSESGEGASGKLDLNDVLVNDENYEDKLPPVRVTQVEGDESSPYVLNADQMQSIAKNVLPETIVYCRWKRLYSLSRDGDSFDGCLRIIGTSKRTLMVVKTTRGDIFGGYAGAPWHSRKDYATAKFYGSASSCLFSFSSPLSASSSSSSPSPIDVYRWTGKNRYIQVCDVSSKMLAFGGGGDKGTFGLCLQEDFQRGTTGHCDTFDNEPLCEEGNFDVVDVEFWEFLTVF